MKNIVITGGTGGIGKALCYGFADLGYNVISIDINDYNFCKENIYSYIADLTSEYEIKSTFNKIVHQFGPIHILINNGAISKFNKSIYEISVDEFDTVLNTNLRGSFICCKEFISANKGLNFGRIINIASTRYNQNEANWEAYGASKGGIVSLTNTLCVSLSGSNITVNCISPGWIETEGYDSFSELDHSQHPSGRVGKPEDIFNVCAFLADEKSDFINGANIVVDGGMTKRMIYF